MSAHTRLAAAERRFVRRFGSHVTFARGYRIYDPETAADAADLEVASATLSGSLTLVLRRANATRVRGSVPAGIAVSAAGVDYVTTSDAEAAGNQLELLITPPLAGSLAVGATVSLSTGSLSYLGYERDVRSVEVQGGMTLGDRVMILSGDLQPRTGDLGPDGRSVVEVLHRAGTWLVRLGRVS